MATTDAQICNIALARIGNTALIDSLAEATAEAQACAALYAQHRDALLCAHEWPFATRRATLAEFAGVERSGWAHAYALPADCLMPRDLWFGARRLRPDQRAVYEIEDDDAAAVLLTDLEAPVELLYTARIETVPRYPPGFVDALAWSLAKDLAIALAVKESLAARADREAELSRQRAIVQAVNAEQPDVNPPAKHIAIRGIIYDEDAPCR